MKKSIFILTIASTLSMSAVAIQKDITVTADIEPTLEITDISGTPLPTTTTLSYTPGRGLTPRTIPTAILTNDNTKGVNVKLANSFTLTSPSGTIVPMTVTYAGKQLSTANELIDRATLGYNADNKSLQQNLVLSQTTQTPLTEAGRYQGIVSLVATLEP